MYKYSKVLFNTSNCQNISITQLLNYNQVLVLMSSFGNFSWFQSGTHGLFFILEIEWTKEKRPETKGASETSKITHCPCTVYANTSRFSARQANQCAYSIHKLRVNMSPTTSVEQSHLRKHAVCFLILSWLYMAYVWQTVTELSHKQLPAKNSGTNVFQKAASDYFSVNKAR